MGFEGRVTQPIPGEPRRVKPQIVEARIDWAHIEQRHSLFDELYDRRYGSIDDLPSQKIMHGDPNYYKYKCRINWIFGLSIKLDTAVRNGVLASPQEIEIVNNFQQFLRDLRARQQAEIQQKITDEDRLHLKGLFEKFDFQNAEKFIKEKYWAPVRAEDIQLINGTLDELMAAISLTSRSKQAFDSEEIV